MNLALGLARGLHLAGSYALFGTGLFPVLFGPQLTPEHAATLRRLVWGSLLAVLVAGIAWFLLQSADMASASTCGQVLAALPIVIGYTRFGHLLLLRLLLCIIAAASFQAGYARIATVSSGIAVIAEAWLDHGAAMSGTTGTILWISAIAHLASGAAWLGSLPALLLMIAGLPQAEAGRLARQYSPFGMACVFALVASAIVQFIYLIGSPSALFTSLYGRVALVKILLLFGLTLLAAMNRFRFAPALSESSDNGSGKKILFSIGVEIALGFAALLAAGLLLNLPPPAMAAMLGPQ